MKIKFLKPFRFIGNNPDDGSDDTVPVGHVVDLENDESTQWLIDNGFAEEVKDTDWWKPKKKERYYFVTLNGAVVNAIWFGTDIDWGKLIMGYVFKTENAAYRYRDYLKAITAVRQDKGVLTPEQICDEHCDGYIHYIGVRQNGCLVVDCISVERGTAIASAIYFDTYKHAKASLNKHSNEWEIIANYDWSRE